MDWLKETLAIGGIICALVGALPYLVGTIRREVHPHPYSWLIWTIVTIVVALGQWNRGGGYGAWPTFLAAGIAALIFILSISRKFEHGHASDHWFLAAAIVGIVPWILMKDPTISVAIMASIDTIGFLPTIRKTWKHSHTEQALLYETGVLRHVFELLALQSYNVVTTIDPIAMIVMDSIMIVIIFRGLWGTRRRKTHRAAQHA